MKRWGLFIGAMVAICAWVGTKGPLNGGSSWKWLVGFFLAMWVVEMMAQSE